MVNHRSGGGGSVVANHRCGSGNSVVVTTLVLDRLLASKLPGVKGATPLSIWNPVVGEDGMRSFIMISPFKTTKRANKNENCSHFVHLVRSVDPTER